MQENGICVGLCKLCKSKYNDKVGSTGNFHKHLKRRHKREYLDNRKGRTVLSESDSGDERNELSSTYDDKINQSIVLNLIVKCNLPPSVIEQPGFRQLMKVVARK